MKNINIEKLATIGSRWTKNDMDRYYINLESADEMYRNLETAEHGSLTLNRRERMAGKVWIDLNTMAIETKGIADAEEVISEIEELIAALDPEEPAAEATETEETRTVYVARVADDNSDAYNAYETRGEAEDKALDYLAHLTDRERKTHTVTVESYDIPASCTGTAQQAYDDALLNDAVGDPGLYDVIGPRWYACMRDREDNDWGTGSFGLTTAQKQLRNMFPHAEYPEAYIAVIENDVCVEELEAE